MDKNLTHLNILVGEWRPFSSVRTLSRTKTITGFMAIFLEVLRKKFSVSYKLMVSPDKAWGARVGQNWSGVIGMLNRSEADILASPVIASIERADAMQLSSVLFVSDAKLLVGVPKTTAFSLQLFSSIEGEVLLGMAMSVVILYILGRLFQYIRKSPEPELPLWNIVEALFMKSPATEAPSRYGAVLICLWSMAVFIILTAFGGEITSALSVSEAPPIIRSLDDVSLFPDVQPIVPQSGYYQWFVQTSEHPALKACWKKVEKDASLTVPWNDYYSDTVLDKIEKATHFNLGEMYSFRSELNNRFLRKGQCQFYLSKSFDSTILTLGYRKNLDTKFQRAVNTLLTRMMETQVLENGDPSQDIFYQRCLWKDENSDDVVYALMLPSFQSAFLILGSGYSFATAVLVLETVWQRRKSNTRKNFNCNSKLYET